MVTQKQILIEAGLRDDMEFAKKCLLALYSKQTREEKNNLATLEDNNEGFTHADAPVLSAYAIGILKGKDISPGYLVDVQHRMFKYIKQLEKILPNELFED